MRGYKVSDFNWTNFFRLIFAVVTFWNACNAEVDQMKFLHRQAYTHKHTQTHTHTHTQTHTHTHTHTDAHLLLTAKHFVTLCSYHIEMFSGQGVVHAEMKALPADKPEQTENLSCKP